MTDNKNQLDEYENLSFYKANTKSIDSGFQKFSKGDKFYFCRYSDGEIALISQAYVSETGRDNGIASVKKNGKFGISLRAGNHQEIAVSGPYPTQADASYVVERLTGARAAKTNARRTPNTEQDYKPLAFYKRQTRQKDAGFQTFKGDDGKHYFTYHRGGRIELISEGYPTKGAMNTGLESTRKNMKLENRIQYKGPFKNGKYDYRIKARNGKEVARSRWYGSAKAALAAATLGWTLKSVAAKPKPKPVASQPKVAPKAAAAGVAAAGVAGGRVASGTPKAEKENDYLPCQAYRGHKVNDTKNNIAFFKHNNGLYYFVLYDAQGDVRLRSEGFNTPQARDPELFA